MKRVSTNIELLKMNPDNTHYYSKDFIKGFECGTNRQFEADMKKYKRGEWIPCSERLPEDPNPSFTYASKTYQVTTASGDVIALKWCKTEVRGKTVMRWKWSSGVIYHGDALAWKPLSEPWKGADDE